MAKTKKDVAKTSTKAPAPKARTERIQNWIFHIGPHWTWVTAGYSGSRITGLIEWDVQIWALKFNLRADADSAGVEFSSGPLHLTFSYSFHSQPF